MKTFKILKILFFISFSTFLLSCNNVITDIDDDGESDTLNFVDEAYDDRENYDMQYNIQSYSSYLNNPKWFTGTSRIRVYTSSFKKDDVTYISYDSTPLKDNTAAVYEIADDIGVGTGQFVFITLEPVPIFSEDMVILLVSKTSYFTAENAKAAAELVNIPKIKMNLSHLDLVFNPTVPEGDYLNYENVEANVAAILVNYNLLEFFGTSYSYEEKQKLLKDYGYSRLFE